MEKSLINLYGLVLLGLCLMPNLLCGQVQPPINLNDFSFEKHLSWKVAYYGELAVHPGAIIGVSYYLPQKEKESKKHFLKQRYVVLNTNLGFYHQAKNHQAYLWNVEMGWHFKKRKNKKRLKTNYKQVLLGLGFYHYRLMGKTFTYDAEKIVSKKGKGLGFTPSIAIALGRQMKAINWHLKPSIALIMPNGIGIRPQFNLEFGVSGLLTKKNK